MKKTTHNFQKPLRRALAMALALVMTLSLVTYAHADGLGGFPPSDWPSAADGGFAEGYYIKLNIYADGYRNEKLNKDENWNNLLFVIEIPGLDAKTATAEDYELTLTLEESNGNAPTVTLEKNNYYLPVRVPWTANDGRQCDIFIIARPEIRDYSKVGFRTAYKEYVAYHDAAQALYETLATAQKGVVGGYQINSSRCLRNANESISPYTDNLATAEIVSETDFRKSMKQKNVLDDKQAASMYSVVMAYYMEYCQRTIQAPVVTGLRAFGAEAVQTGDTSFLLTLPNGVDWTKARGTLELDTPGSVALSAAGNWRDGGTVLLQLYARDPAVDLIYNKETVGIIESNYTLTLKAGAPSFFVTSFAVNGRTATIDEDARTISLHFAQDWSWEQLPEIAYSGSGVTFLDASGSEVTAVDGKIDFSKAKTLRLTLDLSGYAASGASADNLKFTKEYALQITRGNSAECDILSFSVGVAGEQVVFEGTDITVMIPYVTDWADLKSSFTCSYDAMVTKPENEDFANSGKTPLTYLVTAEDGTTSKAYYVSVKKIPAATDNRLVDLCYGSIKGSIDHDKGTVTLTLPSGSSKTLAPTITLPEFATVTPASGVTQDFTDPVTYTVTAQDGTEKSYVVTVEVASQAETNPIKGDLDALLGAIIARYRTKANDDWEWLNLGLYDLKNGYTEPNANDGFDIADIISKRDLGTNGTMTDLDRVTLMLTARGYDCSNLAQYNGGKPFIDKKGNEIDNLVANICETKKLSLNGVIFGLLALDIGNYTLPEGVTHDRAYMLDYMLKLSCKQVASGFMDLDGVPSLMYAIAPYQDDPVFGERVKAKLAEGVEFLAEKVSDEYTLRSWGTENSEVISWTICALSSCGIDVYTDPRFGDGETNLLTQWLKLFALYDGFKHIESETQNNPLATYEACYALQWYINFLEKGGNGHPYYLWSGQHNFSKVLSTEAKILSFELEGKQGVIHEAEEGSDEKNTITLELPKGTPLNSVTPQITLSEKAVLKAPELPTRLTAGTPYPFTVCAEDGKTERVYYVTVIYKDGLEASGTELYTDTIVLEDANQRELEILNKTVAKTETGADILLNIDAGKDVKNLRVTANISYGATASPRLDGSFTMDLSDWMEVVVKAQDGTTKIYRLKAEAKQVASITGFALTAGGKTYQGTIDNEKNTITVSGVDDSALTTTKLAPDITLGSGTTVCSPTSGIAQDFSQEVIYIVSGTNVASRTYKVNVYNQSGKRISANGNTGGDDNPVTPVTGAKITAFSVLGVEGVIDQSAGTITVRLPAGTNVTVVAPTFTATAGAVVSPVSGEVVNLTNPVVYTVTLGDLQTRYTVSVIYERSTSQQLWDKLGDVSDVTDHQTSHAKRNWS